MHRQQNIGNTPWVADHEVVCQVNVINRHPAVILELSDDVRQLTFQLFQLDPGVCNGCALSGDGVFRLFGHGRSGMSGYPHSI